MGQSTPHQDQADPDQRENTISMSVEQPTRDEPVPDWMTIDDDERLIWEGSQSSKQLLPDFLLGLLLVGFGAVLVSIGHLEVLGEVPSTFQLLITGVGLVFAALAVGTFGYNWWSHRKRRYGVTTKATYRKWGGDVTKIEMSDIMSVTSQRYSWVDRLFSCGDLKIQWQKNGYESTTYPAVRHSGQIQDMILENTHGDSD